MFCEALLKPIDSSTPKKLLFACLLLIVLIGSGSAKEPPTARISNYNSDNGLPQNTISMMSFDTEGNLWIGTQGGLVRFNGNDFVDHSSELRNPRISLLKQSLSGTVRLTDGDMNLYSINPINQKIELLESNVDNFLYLLSNYIFEHKSTRINSLPFYSELNITTKNHILPPSQSAYVVSVYGNLFHLAHGDVTKVASDILHVFGDSINAFALLHSGDFYALEEGKVGRRQLMVSENSPVREYDDFWEKAYIIPGKQASYAVYKDHFYRISVRGNKIDISLLLQGLPDISYITHAVYDEKDQVLALGSGTNGVYIITKAHFKTLTVKAPKVYSPANERDLNNLFSLVELNHNSILADNGVLYTDDARRAISMDSISTYFLHKDKNNRLWTAKYQQNIIIRDTAFKVLHKLPLGVHVNTILELPAERFVINKGDTLLLLQADTGGVHIEKKISTHFNIIPDKLHPISANKIWMLTRRGISLVDLSTGQIQAVPGTDGLYCREVVDRPGGYKWLGTYGNGLFLYRGDSLIAMPLDAQKHLRFAHTFLPDSAGFLWISTNKGLFKVQENDLLAYADRKTDYIYYHYFDKTYGLNTNEFNGGGIKSGLIARNGNFYFASMQGLVKFNPLAFEIDLPNAALRIESITIDGSTYYAPYGELNLPPKFARISIKINLPYFGHPANRQIFYRIQGLDATWRPVSADNMIEIPNIKTGEYTLILKKINGFGTNNYSISEIKFRVKPFFYQHWGFRILVLLLIGISIALIIRNRLRQLEKINLVLEEKVSERTIALESAIRDISQQKEALLKNQEILQTIFQVVMHDLSSPLRFLRRLSARIRKNLSSAATHDVEEDVETMHSSAVQAELLTADLLTWLRTRQESSDFRKAFISPDEIARKNLSLYQWIAEDKGIIIKHKEPFSKQAIEVSEDLLGVLIRNCLDNAIKYTKKGSVQLSLYEEASFLHLIVEDTGIGIEEIAVQQINSGLIPYRLQQDKHLGMRLIFDVLQQLQGTMQVESQLGKGTRVHISFPLEADS